jgi:tetraacyldisaccharide 4'-kinase
LRAPLDAQLSCADAVIVVGPGTGAAPVSAAAAARDIPVFQARLEPQAVAAVRGARVLAFAGIAKPDKFFATLADAGATVARKRSFPDHHAYTGAEARALCAAADGEELMLVTTEKDRVRLDGDGELKELASRAFALSVKLVIEEADAFTRLLLGKLAATGSGLGGGGHAESAAAERRRDSRRPPAAPRSNT